MGGDDSHDSLGLEEEEQEPSDDPGAEESADPHARDRLLHIAGADPFALRFVELDEVLDRGGHRPLRCRLEFADGEPAGDWVVKPPISLGDAESREELSVLAELAGAEVCTWAGLPTPAIGVVTIPPKVDQRHLAGRDAETRQQLTTNAGRLAFCSRFLEDAAEWPRDRYRQPPRGRDLARAYGLDLMFLDAYMLHDDRTPQKPNFIEHRGRLLPIDHGNAFVGLDREGAGIAAYVAGSRLSRCWAHHVFEPPLRSARKDLGTPVSAEKLSMIPDESVRALGERWPATLETTKTRAKRGIVSEMIEFLLRRREHAPEIASVLLQFLGKTDG